MLCAFLCSAQIKADTICLSSGKAFVAIQKKPVNKEGYLITDINGKTIQIKVSDVVPCDETHTIEIASEDIENNSQTNTKQVSYEDVKAGRVTKGSFESYISKDGFTYKIGERVEFGAPSGINGKFVTIMKFDIMGTSHPVGAEALNTSAEIKRIGIVGTSRSGYKVSFQTKGMSVVDNYFFNIEDAISVGEIKSKGMTSEQALAELKRAKDKLELEIITQEEYNKIKAELIKYIK
jgi:hypothetical protein